MPINRLIDHRAFWYIGIACANLLWRWKRRLNGVRQSEDRYRRLVKRSHNIIYELTPEGLINFASAICQLMLGHDGPDGAINQPDQALVHPDDLPSLHDDRHRPASVDPGIPSQTP